MDTQQSPIPRCSVIVLTRNSSKTLRRCMDSVLVQEPKDFELLIVDYMSTDGTRGIVERYAKKDPRVRLIPEKRPGLGAARNTGIREARAPVLVWTDSDCEAPKGWLKALLKPIDAGEDFVLGNEEAIGRGYWSYQAQLAGQRHKGNHREGRYIAHVDPKNMAMRKDVIVELGGFDPKVKYLEDYDLFVRLKKAGHRVRYLPDLRIRHHHRSTFRAMAETRKLRGYWSAVVFQKHKGFFDSESKKDITIKSNYGGTIFASSLGLLKMLFTLGPGVFFYETISSVYWRIGIARGKREWRKELGKE